MTIKINNLSDISAAAETFIKALGPRRHVAFHGAMGAGKTTFIAAVCDALKVTDEVNSPTFSIINEYRDGNDNTVYHFDFYRIEDEREILDLGLDEYFDSNCLCMMEWPENIEDYLPEDTLHVAINVDEKGERTLSFEDFKDTGN